MKALLLKILELFAAGNRSKMNNPAHREYCICGALKQVERPGRELSLKAESRPQRI